MTRAEFDNITTWEELIRFCRDNNIGCCEDILHCDDVGYQVRSILENSGWQGVANFFSNNPNTDGEYYRLDPDGFLEYMDEDDLYNTKDEAGQEYERYEGWDEDDYEDDYEEPIDENYGCHIEEVPVEEAARIEWETLMKVS